MIEFVKRLRIEQSNSLFEGEDQLEVKVTPSLPPEFTIIASKSSIGSLSVLVSSIYSNITGNVHVLIEFKEVEEDNGKYFLYRFVIFLLDVYSVSTFRLVLSNLHIG